MKLEDCKKWDKIPKPVQVNIKITKGQSKFLSDKELSPTAVFNEALKELGHKE